MTSRKVVFFHNKHIYKKQHYLKKRLGERQDRKGKADSVVNSILFYALNYSLDYVQN